MFSSEGWTYWNLSALKSVTFLFPSWPRFPTRLVFSPFISHQSLTSSWLMLFSTLRYHMPALFAFSLHCICSSTPFMNHSFAHWLKWLRKMSMLGWVNYIRQESTLRCVPWEAQRTHHSSKPLGMSCESDTTITKKLRSGSFLLTRNDSKRCNPRTRLLNMDVYDEALT